MSVDLGFQRERGILWVDQVSQPPTPTRLILQAAGTWSGTLQNGMALSGTARLQDVNPQNVAGNPYGTALGLTTYLHYFTTIATRYLYDLTDGSVYDLSAYDMNSLIVVWPSSF